MADDEQIAADDEQPSAAGPGPAPEAGPAHGQVRYTRRRVLILGGAFAAGLAAVIAGFKAFGGSAADKVGGADRRPVRRRSRSAASTRCPTSRRSSGWSRSTGSWTPR